MTEPLDSAYRQFFDILEALDRDGGEVYCDRESGTVDTHNGDGVVRALLAAGWSPPAMDVAPNAPPVTPVALDAGSRVEAWRFSAGLRSVPFQPPITITGPGYLLQRGNQVGVYDAGGLSLRAVYQLTDDGSVFELDSTRTRLRAFGGVGLVEQQPDHRRALTGQPPTG